MKNPPSNYYAIILAGGEGSRFWPQSRTLEPKQFLTLYKKKSLFEQTIMRIKPLVRPENIFIVTSNLYRRQINELVRPFAIPEGNLIFEPKGKNTAPSICAAASLIHQKDHSALICAFPCDHLIKNKKEFMRIIQEAFEICQHHLVVFGIVPNRPDTGYGYIKAGKAYRGVSGVSSKVYQVSNFCEKPDIQKAKRFLKDKLYFWNSGIFAGPSRVFLSEFKTHLPLLYRQLHKISSPADISGIWDNIKPASFDYGVLEKSSNLLMIAAFGLGWSDLGSWQALDEELKKDNEGNLIDADAISINSKNITVLGKHRLIATVGLKNLIIVDTPDAVLITEKNKTEGVKQIVDILKSKKRSEHYSHKTEKRPWGSFTVLDTGCGFKVKIIEVKPGAALSLQFHRKRSEHWVVVDGKAEITKGKKKYILDANENIYFPVGCLHRLGNPGKKMLKIIEVQCGSYLEEDDIVRLEDSFGRASK